jgi:hypothetical protein
MPQKVGIFEGEGVGYLFFLAVLRVPMPYRLDLRAYCVEVLCGRPIGLHHFAFHTHCAGKGRNDL